MILKRSDFEMKCKSQILLSNKLLAQNILVQRQKQPPEVFCQKSVLRNFAKSTGKHLCQSLFFNKDPGLRPATLLKMRLWYRYFPVNFATFLRTSFLQNTSGRLFLQRAHFKSGCNALLRNPRLTTNLLYLNDLKKQQ